MGEEGSADSTIIVPTFKSKPAAAADKVINLQEMNEQDVKCLQTTGEFHVLVTALSADLPYSFSNSHFSFLLFPI